MLRNHDQETLADKEGEEDNSGMAYFILSNLIFFLLCNGIESGLSYIYKYYSKQEKEENIQDRHS